MNMRTAVTNSYSPKQLFIKNFKILYVQMYLSNAMFLEHIYASHRWHYIMALSFTNMKNENKTQITDVTYRASR